MTQPSKSSVADSSAATVVLYIVQAAFFAGAERALLVLLKGLDKTRYTPHVIVGTEGEMQRQLDAEGIANTYIELCYSDWRHPIRWIRSVGAIARVARSIGASLIHGNGVPGFQPAGYAARLLGIPAVVHVRGRLAQGGYSWFLKPGFERALFVSQHLLDYACEQDAEVFGTRSQVIYDGVAMPTIPDREERTRLLGELNIPAHVPSVVLSGQVVEIKGIWEYIEAARLLTAAGVSATYVVLGDDLLGKGATRVQAEERVRALGLANQFRFLGFRPNASQLIPLFDIAAMPSHNEPLGLAALEAMAAARPVVGSRVGGILETVVDGETGLLVQPRDAPDLARALSRLITNADLRARLGEAGRTRAESAFSIPAHVKRVQDIYGRVLMARNRTSPSSSPSAPESYLTPKSGGVDSNRLKQAPD